MRTSCSEGDIPSRSGQGNQSSLQRGKVCSANVCQGEVTVQAWKFSFDGDDDTN